MRKYRRNNKRFIVVIAIIAVVTVIILLATIVLPNAAKEKEYQKGLEAVQTKDYATAESIFKDLAQEDFKDSFFANTLMQYRLEFESVKEKTAIASDYDTVMADIDKYSEIFNNVGDTDNDIIIADISSAQNEVMQLKNDIEEKQRQDQEREDQAKRENEQFLQTIVNEVNSGKKTYGSAARDIEDKGNIKVMVFAYAIDYDKKKVWGLVDDISGKPIDNEEFRVLYLYYNHQAGKSQIDAEIEEYANADLSFFEDKEVTLETVKEFRDMYSKNSNDNFAENEIKMNLIAGINPDYNGVNANEVVNAGIEYFGSKEEWQAQYNHYIETETELLNAEVQKSKPEIGMTELEVIKTAWGAPEKKNTTTTSGGTSEQWVYSDNRYVYLDNGIVTAVQE